MVISNISLMKDTFDAKPHKPFLRVAIDNKPVLMPACVGAPVRGRCDKGQPLVVRRGRKAKGCPTEVARLPKSGVSWRTITS
jgi:hypothetical protein